jgi:A/G-specific adenine glycosylase
MARHGGEVPRTPEELRALPGVGRYVAGAVLSLAHDAPEPILETNTRRLLARLLGWAEPLERSSSQRRLWEAASRLVPQRGAGRFNQSLMDLGAEVCTVKRPACGECPLAGHCQARATGRAESLPEPGRRVAVQEAFEACAVIRRRGRVLLVRRERGRLWEGMYEFPVAHRGGADPAGRALPGTPGFQESLRLLTGLELEAGPVLRTLRYAVTRYRVSLEVHACQGERGRPVPGPGLDRCCWVGPRELDDHPLSSPHRRIARWVTIEGIA